MKRSLYCFVVLVGLGSFSYPAFSQVDYALRQVFKDYELSVFSISVEIPQEVILERYEKSIQQLRDLQSRSSTVISQSTETLSFNFFEHLIGQYERQANIIKNQFINSNRVRGAGFAISPHHLVTISTVVKSATLGGEITVTNTPHESHQLTVKGIDEWTGIAVLEATEPIFTKFVDLRYVKEDYPPLTEASFIMSIQRPYDLPASPSWGMIGGFYITLGENYLFKIERYIQTDLPLYPGCEGSPVFSPMGDLVGMLAVDFPAGGYPRLTFVIPADIIADSALEIIEKGKRDRGQIPGILDYGLSNDGLLITDIEQGSPAHLAGFREGDLIIGINDQRFHDARNLFYKVLDLLPNQFYQIEYQRGKEVKKVNIRTKLMKDLNSKSK